MISANCHQTRSHINCTQQQNNKLHKDGQKLRPKDVGGINKHCATVGIGYCRCTAVVQKRYNIKFVCTLFSTGQRLYLSWARWIQNVSSIACQYVSVSLWNKFNYREGISSSFLEKKSVVCDSMHVHYHLQWNVSSVNKPNIPFIFMGVKCDFLHWKNKVFWGTVRKNVIRGISAL